MLQGVYDGFTTKFDEKIEISPKLKNPLLIKKNNQNIDFDVNDNIDIIDNGKVNFSIKMIQETVKNLTFLYMQFLTARMGKGRFINIKEEDLRQYENFFKFFMTRRILKNYSNIPSGWLCVKIEDYTTRAIASAVDRDMIIAINSKNNGTHSAFSSDVEASSFLFSYWSFMYEEKIIRAIEKIDFVYNATKEIHEIEAYRASKETEELLRNKIEEEYSNMDDNNLVYIDEMLKDDEEVIKRREKVKEINKKYLKDKGGVDE
jgi:hypothetical protein